MSEIPPFWFKKPGIAAWLLSPFSLIYGRGAAKRMQLPAKYISTLPVICIGNFVTGGAGKTPTALAFAKIARSMGLRAGFLSRGYGGHVSEATLVDRKIHNAHDVGDEPLILAKAGPAVVSADRPAGAMLLEQQKIDFILMDDGFQNPSLYKDFSLAVIDSRRGIGNGYCIPAGPLRADLQTQLTAASALLLIGKSSAVSDVIRPAAKMAKPLLQASLRAGKPRSIAKKKILAFAGIADPQKFYESLEQVGGNIVEKRNFHDHHPFSSDECRDLLNRADTQGLILVTTEKDHVRLSKMGKWQERLQEASLVLKVELVFENPKMIEMLIAQTMEEARMLRRSTASKPA